MKSYNFFRKTFFLFSLDFIFLKSKFISFSNISIINSAHWIKLKKLFSFFGIKFCFPNKILLKKKCLTLSSSLKAFDFFKNNLLVVYSFNLNYKKLFENISLANELSSLFLCSYYYKRFMFLNQFQYFLKKNTAFVFFELSCILNYFLNKSLHSILLYKKCLF